MAGGLDRFHEPAPSGGSGGTKCRLVGDGPDDRILGYGRHQLDGQVGSDMGPCRADALEVVIAEHLAQ